MKKRVISALLILAAITTVSCKKKGCTYENALNYSVEAELDDGSCNFEPEVEPVVDPRDKFLGSYTVVDSSFNAGTFMSTTTYVLVVTTGSTVSDTIYLGNWRNTGDNYEAYAAGNNFSVPDNGNPENGNFSGFGSFSGDNVKYEAVPGGSSFVTYGNGSK